MQYNNHAMNDFKWLKKLNDVNIKGHPHTELFHTK